MQNCVQKASLFVVNKLRAKKIKVRGKSTKLVFLGFTFQAVKFSNLYLRKHEVFSKISSERVITKEKNYKFAIRFLLLSLPDSSFASVPIVTSSQSGRHF